MVVVSSTFSAPASGILFQSSGTKLLVNDQELGTATLYITENNVIWGGGVLPSGTAAPTITLSYPHISLHAVQREPSPALYLVLSYELRVPQLQTAVEGAGDAPADDDDDEFDGDNQPITQLRFIPPNEADLTGLYQAMNHGQQLHPDPEDDDYMDGEDVDEGDEEEFEDAEESAPSAEEAEARLRQLRLGNANGAPHYDDNGTDEAIDE